MSDGDEQKETGSALDALQREGALVVQQREGYSQRYKLGYRPVRLDLPGFAASSQFASRCMRLGQRVTPTRRPASLSEE